jgi:chaperonin cofactor prefoldin
MAKKTKKAVQILTKEKERLETRTEALKKEGSELWKRTKL